ncbi:flagellar hook-basal body complex protein FliE [Oceanobacillus sp. CAU 1775]
MNINFNPQVGLQNEAISKVTTPATTQSNFGEILKGTIENLNNVQNESDRMTNALASGNAQDLHQVMIAAQKASITLETTVQFQQKAIDAYNEIMRMQI